MSRSECSFTAGRGAGRRSDRWNRRGGVDMPFQSSHRDGGGELQRDPLRDASLPFD
jgi:hypothetical protein